MSYYNIRIFDCLQISWLRRYTSSKSVWTVINHERLLKLGCTNFDPSNTDSKTIRLLFSKYPDEFISLPLYEQQEITIDLTTIIQPWCENLVISDLMTENLDLRRIAHLVSTSRVNLGTTRITFSD